MLVKKFEAKSMKEALELVKTHMGPEAIILAAKDMQKSFGLVGDKSVEVTAAVSENTVRKKALAEQKLNDKDKQRFANSPAKQQKEFIDKVFNQHQVDNTPRSFTETPYIDISEEGLQASKPEAPESKVSAEQRIRSAAMEASIAASIIDEDEIRKAQAKAEAEAKAKAVAAAQAKAVAQARAKANLEKIVNAQVDEEKTKELERLRSEVSNLRKLLEGFQKVPQNMITLHPGADHGLPYEMSEMYQKLTRAGVGVENTVDILKQAKDVLSPEQYKKAAFLDAWVVKYLLDGISVATDRSLDRYQVFVGPTGQGKSSSLVKMASHLVIKEKKKVAIVTCDTDRIGVSEQLKIFAQILNVPFAEIRKPSQWGIVDKELRGVDNVFVDTPGLSLKSMGEVDRLRALMPPETGGRRVHYVQSLLARDDEAFEVADRYRSIGFHDVIFTHLDDAAQHGLIYNFYKRFQSPLHSYGIGRHIPEDFEPATKERVVDLIFKLTKVKGKRV